MRKIILISILIFLRTSYAQGQIVEENDTLYLNYRIGLIAYGIDEGLMIYKSNDTVKAKSIRYNVSSYSLVIKVDTIDNYINSFENYNPMEGAEWLLSKEIIDHVNKVRMDSLVQFYGRNKNNYTIIKPEWALSQEQCNYITQLLDEIKVEVAKAAEETEEYVFSTSSVCYVVISKKEKFMYTEITSPGRYLELKEVLGIIQRPEKKRKKGLKSR